MIRSAPDQSCGSDVAGQWRDRAGFVCGQGAALLAKSCPAGWGSDSNGAKSHVKGRCWDRLASQGLSPSVSQGTIWRYVAVDRRLGYA